MFLAPTKWNVQSLAIKGFYSVMNTAQEDFWVNMAFYTVGNQGNSNVYPSARGRHDQ